MRRGVDGAREPRDDHESAPAQLQGQVASEAPAVGRGVPRPDHRDRRPRQERGVAAQRQQRRRVVGGGERRGVIGLAPGDEPCADALHRRHLPLRRAAAADEERPAPPGALGEIRQRVECRRGRAVALQQLILGGIEQTRGYCPATMRRHAHQRQSGAAGI